MKAIYGYIDIDFKGRIEGFDRLVFKETLRPIAFALGMQAFLGSKGVLNKEYKDRLGCYQKRQETFTNHIESGF